MRAVQSDTGTRTIVGRLLSTDNSEPVAESGIALLRIATGIVVAALHGWHKVVDGLHYATTGTHWPLLDDTVAMGFPLPIVFTGLAAIGQFVGGCLLAIGAYTRIAAVLVASTLLTALVFNLRTGGPDAQLAGLYALVACIRQL